jgi:hypothetical protein
MATAKAALKTGYRWNEAAGRFIDLRGRFVSPSTVRSALDESIRVSQRRIKDLAQSLREGRINLPQWQINMASELKAGHLAGAATGRGGLAQLTQSDLGRAGQLLKKQYEKLNAFALQIERGYPLDGRFLRRVDLYAESPRATYHVFHSLEMAQHGFEYEENVLGSGDSCDGCLGETARGRVPIGELEPIGSRTCLTRCKCSISYFKAA